jgi:hypothetical protein
MGSGSSTSEIRYSAQVYILIYIHLTLLCGQNIKMRGFMARLWGVILNL